MTTRRQLLSAAAIGAVAATTGANRRTLADDAKPAPVAGSPKAGRYRPPQKLGFGGVAIGNAFYPTTDAISRQALEAAWAGGVRYFDTSPWYGLGLSERRLGAFLHEKERDEYVVSTKIGRLLKPDDAFKKPMLWKQPSPFRYEYDYSAAGARRSIEDSLNRLGIASLDVVFIHDLSPDNGDMGAEWVSYFETAMKGAAKELTKMRDEGVIKAWGFGVNTIEPCLRALQQSDPDVFLSACQYSLIEHEKDLNTLFPACAERGASIVVGAPLNSGFLAGRERYNYSDNVPEAFRAKRERLRAIAKEHGVDLRTAAIQFCAAPDVVAAVIPGARTAEQASENVASMKVAIPAAFWDALRAEKLIAANAPTPKGAA